MPKLTDTQFLILTRASARPGNLALPLPDGLHGAAAKMAIGRMIKLGFIEEVEAKLRRKDPLWRETGDGHGTTLIATEAGLAAVGIEPLVSRAVASARRMKAEPASEGEGVSSIPGPAGTKQAAIIALLQRSEGASIAEIVAATGWLAHSVRGMISGALKKKLGLPITSEKVEDRGVVHRILTMD
ncbi:DUF3489 domain-containing protein [Salipiger abyssi]|uniref:DUF3489 domain-containing protein n=1 Tax=Salipiger abyssi TaxID=1250539 RepID=UPI004058A5B0